jgi:hypothetical protein
MVPSSLDEGYFPNELENGDFSLVTNGTADSWNQLIPSAPATVVSQNSTNVLELQGTAGLYQAVFLNKTKVNPVRVAGIAKSVNVTGGASYSMYPNEALTGLLKRYADIYHNDGSVKRISALFPLSEDEYTTAEATYTPPVPIISINYTIIANSSTGSIYFQEVAFQEKIPNVTTTFQCFSPLVSKCRD